MTTGPSRGAHGAAALAPRPPVVPGVTTGRLLGVGGHAQVWSGIDSESGALVALKVLDVDSERLDGSRREIQLLRRIAHRHVVRLLRVERTTTGQAVLVLEHAAGGSLRALVEARGPLDAGEVVTVLTPLAEALAELHGRGLVHGDVSPGNVLFGGDGRPLLADLGVGRILGVEAATHATPGYADPALALSLLPTPAGDVYSLGALAWYALTGRAPQPAGQRPPLVSLAPTIPPALAALVENCLDFDPARRPEAAALAVAAYGSAAAEPVRLVPTDPHADAAEVVTHRLRRDAADADADETPRRRRWNRTGWAVGGVVTLLAATVAATLLGLLPGPAEGRAGLAKVAPKPPAADVAEDPAQAVIALSVIRAQAFSSGDGDLLRQANVAESSALATDLQTLATLDASGARLRDLSFHVTGTDVVSNSGGVAAVTATVVTRAHAVVGRADGEVRQEVARSAPRTVTVTLLWADGRWKVASVR